MGAIAVIATGGYFGYDYWETKKAKERERAEDKAREKQRAAGPTGDSGQDRAAHPPGSGDGSSEGSEGSGPGSEVSHRVQRLKVPNVVGMKPEAATAALVALGFKPDVLEMPPNLGCHYEDEQHDIVPVGAICNQERDPGEILMSNAKLRVVVEKDTWEHGGVEIENEWHRMPELVGMPLEAANELLRSKGFSEDEFAIGEARTSCGKGVVCEQHPNPEARKYVNQRGDLNIGN